MLGDKFSGDSSAHPSLYPGSGMSRRAKAGCAQGSRRIVNGPETAASPVISAEITAMTDSRLFRAALGILTHLRLTEPA